MIKAHVLIIIMSLSPLILKEPSPSVHTNPATISTTSNKVNAMLQSLLTNFRDVFPNDLPPSLLHEHAITHGIDLMPGSKAVSRPLYHLSASEANEVEKQLQDYLQCALLLALRPYY